METVYTITVNNSGIFWRNKEGQLHRLGGLPAIEYANGGKFYYENDQRHRLGGLPAIECAPASGSEHGDKYYYENGQFHRLGGPAIDRANGYKEWWINGKLLKCNTQKEFEQLMKLKAFW